MRSDLNTLVGMTIREVTIDADGITLLTDEGAVQLIPEGD